MVNPSMAITAMGPKTTHIGPSAQKLLKGVIHTAYRKSEPDSLAVRTNIP